MENEDFQPRDIDWGDCELFSALKTPDDPQQGLDSFMWKDIGMVSVNLKLREGDGFIFKMISDLNYLRASPSWCQYPHHVPGLSWQYVPAAQGRRKSLQRQHFAPGQSEALGWLLQTP